MEEMGEMEAEDCQDQLAHKGQLEFLVPRGLQGKKVIMGPLVCLDLKETKVTKENWDHLVKRGTEG